MASRSRAARRRRTAASIGVGRGRKRRLESVLQRHMAPIMVAGIAALVLVLGAVGLYAAQRGGLEFDFAFDVYQGGDVLGGAHVRLSDVAGQGQPVVLNFWAGNCPPCRFEMPAFQRSYESHGDEVFFLGIDVGVFTGLGSRQSALALLSQLGITYPAGAPPDRGAVVNYRITAMPTTVFFDADGQVFRRWEGTINEGQLDAILAEMIQ